MLKPVIAAGERDEEHRADRPFDVFGKRHRRISPGKLRWE
jgi:hypothetical protein